METYVTNAISGKADISQLASVATSGSYYDLSDYPGSGDDHNGAPVTWGDYNSDLYGEDPVVKQSELSSYLTQEDADERYEFKSE